MEGIYAIVLTIHEAPVMTTYFVPNIQYIREKKSWVLLVNEVIRVFCLELPVVAQEMSVLK